MPDHTFGSEFSKGDFGDKLRLHPMHPAAHFTRHIQGGGVLGKGGNLFPQILNPIRTEPGADRATMPHSFTAILRRTQYGEGAAFRLIRKGNLLNSSTNAQSVIPL